MEKELRKLIESLGITQVEFSRIIGVDKMSLRNYLQGRIPRFQRKYLRLIIYTINKEGLDNLKNILGE